MKKRLKKKTLKEAFKCSHLVIDIRTTCDLAGYVVEEEYSYCAKKHENCNNCKSFSVAKKLRTFRNRYVKQFLRHNI